MEGCFTVSQSLVFGGLGRVPSARVKRDATIRFMLADVVRRADPRIVVMNGLLLGHGCFDLPNLQALFPDVGLCLVRLLGYCDLYAMHWARISP